MKRCIRLSREDNVATVLDDAKPGDIFTIFDQADKVCGEITAESEIPFAHKISLRRIYQGERIIKMKTVIGEASADIPKGVHAHIHNIISMEGIKGVKDEI